MTVDALENVLTSGEREILEEVINIAFGKASADLASLVDIYVTLSVPSVRGLGPGQTLEYITEEVGRHGLVSMIEQNFWGRFKGVALLIFPSGAEKRLVSLLNGEEAMGLELDETGSLEIETLQEVGNILAGASVGKVAELLDDVVTYSPPYVAVKENPVDLLAQRLSDPDVFSVAVKTVFSFRETEIDGYLFLLSTGDSTSWLKKALNCFMERY